MQDVSNKDDLGVMKSKFYEKIESLLLKRIFLTDKDKIYLHKIVSLLDSVAKESYRSLDLSLKFKN